MADSLESKPLSSFFEIPPALLDSCYARPHRFHKTKLADFAYKQGHWVRCPETIYSHRDSLQIDSITAPSRFILINDSQKNYVTSARTQASTPETMSTATITVTDQQDAEQALAAALAYAGLPSMSLTDLQTVMAQGSGGSPPGPPLSPSSNTRAQNYPPGTGGGGPPGLGNPLGGPQGGPGSGPPGGGLPGPGSSGGGPPGPPGGFPGPRQGLPQGGIDPAQIQALAAALRIALVSEEMKKPDELDRKSTRLNSSHERRSRMPSSA